MNYIDDIQNRKNLTKLRIGSSKLYGHKYLSKNETNKCTQCGDIENTLHFVMDCKNDDELREQCFLELIQIQPEFKSFSNKSKLMCILNAKFQNCNDSSLDNKFILVITKFINDMFRLRFKIKSFVMFIIAYSVSDITCLICVNYS